MIENPEISVLVCTRNRVEDLKRCVDSILKNTFKKYELVIVDQSDSDDSENYILGLGSPFINYIRSTERGLSKARNIAIKLARAPIVVFTDDDCICDEQWIEMIYHEYQSNELIMGVFGKVLPWGNRFSEGLFCHCLIDVDRENTVCECVPPHKYLGHGNNMSFKKELLEKIGLYNPSMGAGTLLKSGEDTDFTFRALSQGYCLKYSPAPIVYHNNWVTLEKAHKMDQGYILGFVSVFGKFALRGNKVAVKCLKERLGELLNDIIDALMYKNIRKFINTTKKIGYFFLAVFPAIYFSLKSEIPYASNDD